MSVIQWVSAIVSSGLALEGAWAIISYVRQPAWARANIVWLALFIPVRIVFIGWFIWLGFFQ